ncbi:BamA/TamA family outer membrane protein [Vibrio amylolyticus]|uniref:BamA/TamA family outer membrane protein n=1 Tax=Vibrio amylolyticus TaxID=2847292 RepID=UPI00354E9154
MKLTNLVVSAALALTITPAQASFMEQFLDPQDGQLDASQWVLNNSHGFLPIPFVITEPAVGVGAGAALLFFHETEEQKTQRQEDPEAARDIPLSVTGVIGGATSNGTYVTGVFHSGNWMDDRVRYFGGLFGASINLNFYGGEDDTPYKFNMQGLYFTQDIDVRLGDSNFFLGGSYTYLNSDSNFDVSGVIPGVNQLGLESGDGSVKVKLTYDNRNNQMSPESGTKAGIAYIMHDNRLGGDFDYKRTHAYVNNYNKISDSWGIAFRGDAKSIDGEAPFYARPFLDMRGMPAMRYQGDDTVLGEVELSYNINQRWTILGFTGAGVAVDNNQSLSDANVLTMKGTGFRYLIARELGMKTGVDIAKGPEEWTVYLQFGTAW